MSSAVSRPPAERAAADYLPLDERAARRFADDWTPVVLSQLARFRLPADLAEDAAQEVLLRALRGLADFRGDARLSTWLYTITWREGLRARQRDARRRREQPLPEGAEPAAPDRADPVAAADERSRLQGLLDELPPRQRLALGYHYLEDLSVTEIAAVMGAPAGSVKAWLKRGRDRLRARWAGDTDA